MNLNLTNPAYTALLRKPADAPPEPPPEPVLLTTAMTSATTPAPNKVIFSSQYDAGTSAAYLVFDGKRSGSNTSWGSGKYTFSGSVGNQWIGYVFPSDITVSRVDVYNHTALSASNPRDVQILVGDTEDIAQAAQVWSGADIQRGCAMFSASFAAALARVVFLRVTKNWGHNNINVSEIELYGY